MSCHPERVEESSIVQPKLLTAHTSFNYPPAAHNQGIEGKVVVRLLVNKEGQVIDTKILRSSGYEILDAAALKMVRSSVYEPGTIEGVVSDFWLHLPIEFKLDEKHRFTEDISLEEPSGLKKLYYHYQHLAYEIGKSRSMVANKSVLIIVEESVSQPWLEFQGLWPLGFLLFQDYIGRYPESDYASKSHDELIGYLQHEISILEQKSFADTRYATIYSLISEYLKKLYDQDLK
jgi:protein TonB